MYIKMFKLKKSYIYSIFEKIIEYKRYKNNRKIKQILNEKNPNLEKLQQP